MKSVFTKLGVVILSSSIIFSQTAMAARMGSGKNSGMQRNVNSQQYSNSSSGNNYGNSNYSNQAGTPQRNGPGVGTVVAGAAAGAVGGYMLGKAMNSNNGEKMASSQVARQESQSSNIPWGIIIILGMLLFIGLMIFRRKTMPQNNLPNPFTNPATANNNNFEIPSIRKEGAGSYSASNPQPQQTTIQQPVNTTARMADGVETQYFLRQAKGMFLHIQSMNTPENVSEVEKYMTPELYAELKQSITANDYIADFSQLDCQLLQSNVEDNNYIASVKFFGKVSESPSSPAVDFNEIWHFVKPTLVENAKWKVAGIQQASTVN